MSIWKIKSLKLQKSLVLALKILLFAVVIYFFYVQIKKLSWEQFQEVELQYWIYLLFVFLLFGANWYCEILKWKKILNVHAIAYDFKQLQQSFFAGITTSIITPNRIGNFIGRMLFFRGKVKAQIMLGTLYGNYAQFIATILLGAFGLFFVDDIIFIHYGKWAFYLMLIFTLLSVGFYFLIPYISFGKLKFLFRKMNVLLQFQKQSKKIYLSLFTLSVVRYFAFSLQYFFFFMAFGEKPTFILFAAINVFYLISTLIPSIFIGKLLIRETTGLIILSYFVENSAIIVVSSLLLWFVNLAVPTLIGLFFMLRKKYGQLV